MAQPQGVTLNELARELDADLVGSGTVTVRGVAHPAEIRNVDQLALAMTKSSLAALDRSPARAAVVAIGSAVPAGRLDGYLVVGQPRQTLARLMAIFAPLRRGDGVIHPSAVIDASAIIGSGVSLGAFCVVGAGASIADGTTVMSQATIGAGARLGQNCLIHAGVRIGDNIEIGDRVIIHPNAVLGADGFSFATPEDGNLAAALRRDAQTPGGRPVEIRRINSGGTVVIGDDVEIGAGTAIDRATIGATTIGRGTKIDNLVMVAHNVRIGEDCLIVGQVGIAGSAVIGNRVVLAGQVGVADHATIGDDAVIMARSGVAGRLPPRDVYVGTPAVKRHEKLEELLMVGRVKRLLRDVEALNKRLGAIEQEAGDKGHA